MTNEQDEAALILKFALFARVQVSTFIIIAIIIIIIIIIVIGIILSLITSLHGVKEYVP